MKKTVQKILLSLSVLSLLATAAFAADGDSSLSSSFTSTNNVKNAQVAMATNEYIVTAGDIYTLAFGSGSFSISVDSTYRVRIANLGIVNAKGLTLQEFKNKVESLVVSNYPSGGIQFFLTNPAQFHVFIKGEVTAASTFDTWALVRASDIISAYYTNYSSRRFFTIISAEGKETKYDLYEAKRKGNFSQDPYLRPGDTIVVPKIDRQVSIAGEVYRPGVYELETGDELHALIFDYAEGFSPYANKNRIELNRFVGGQPMYETEYLKETDLHSDKPLACFDTVTVSSIYESQGMIYMEGAVAETSGGIVSQPTVSAKLKFSYRTGKSLIQFVSENRGLFLDSADLRNAYIWRKAKSENEEEQKIAVNIHAILYPAAKDSPVEDVVLEAEDVLVIPFTQYYVNVTGGVTDAGKYPYQPGRTYEYYIGLAMGINYDQNLFNAIKITDKNGKKLSKKSVIPPEATIYASRNSPKGGWLVPLLTSIISFLTTCLSFGLTVNGLVNK